MRYPAVMLCALILTACIPQADAPRTGRSAPPPPSRRIRAEPERTPPSPPPQEQWEAHPVTADARTVSASTWLVKPGDSLNVIGERTGTGGDAIARANALTPPYALRPGQRLTIPAGRYHLVRPGQTGIAIARAYGVRWSQIVEENALTEPYLLRNGQRLRIPGTGAAGPNGPVSLEQRAAAFHLDLDDLLTGDQPALADNARPARPSGNPKRVPSPAVPVAEPTHLTGGFTWPLRGTLIGRFGADAHGLRSNGIKIATPLGTPIHAAADGVVAYVGSDIAALGGLVILRHGAGYATVYAHAGELLVQRGQSVKRGQIIARSGNSGTVEQPALYFEIRQGRTPIDPLGRLHDKE